MGEALLAISNLNKHFDTTSGHIQALQNIDLHVQEGEFITVIGPSGCGKSTLLRIVAGLDSNYSGSVTLEGAEIRGPGIDKGFIFQEHRLFPWLTVLPVVAVIMRLGPCPPAPLPEKVQPLMRSALANMPDCVHLWGYPHHRSFIKR
ncbi:ATP-binding cassette domain-containing protein [Paenibacillus sp. 19GGS1-52]|nr:ATP-binding cassette domain-containing protein [Paenibacillus sp. 19GGS1-52]